MTKETPVGCRAAGPKKQTIALLKQFARAYHAVSPTMGIVLN